MKPLVVFVVLIVVVSTSFSQTIPLINSGEVIQKGKTLYDSGKYADALQEYYKVPARDTNYLYMLYEAALAHIGDKKYDKALEVCEKGLKNPKELHADFLRLQAIATDKSGEVEKSINLFKKALEKYPCDYNLLYNLGITYYNSKAYEKAVETFFKVLYLNPFHSGSHFNLGRIAIGQGRKTHGMLSLGIYLAIANTDNTRLVMLNNFVDNQITDEGTLPLFGSNAPEKVDQIIKAKIAMDKNFKSKVAVNAPIVKQYEMMFEQFQTISENSDDAWMAFYGAIYRAIKAQNMVEPFLYHLLASSSNETVAKWNSKNEKALLGFYQLVNLQLKKHREKLDPVAYGFAFLGYNKPVMAWFDDNHNLQALGDEIDGMRKGRWVFLHNNQQLSGEGTYSDKGEKKGTWKFYQTDGTIKSVENIDTGEVTLYFSNGLKREYYFTVHDKTEGEVEIFYPCNSLKEKLPYKAGKREGKGAAYFSSGKTKMSYEYHDNNGMGEFVTYYEDGALLNKANYTNDKLSGKYTTYHPNGKIKIEGEYANDAPVGTWKYYFMNGQLEKTGAYQNGIAVGEWNYYDNDGTLNEKRPFDNEGRYHGDNNFYHNGKLYVTYTYKKDILTKMICYDEQGKEIFKSSGNDGSLHAKTYFLTGELRSEGDYKKGKQQGTWRYYYRNGKLSSEYRYEEGLIQGTAQEYFESGEKKYIFNYENNELHGYFQEFYAHGSLKQEGWFQNGSRQQQWLSYYPNGTVESDYYYLSDQFHDKCYNYAGDGKLYSTSLYDDNGIVSFTYYDSQGNVTVVDKFDSNIVKTEDTYPNKKIRSRYQMTCGDYTGNFKRWYPNGDVFYSYSFENGKKTGPYQRYFPTSRIYSEGQYLNDQETGTWKWYYDNGQLNYEARYLEGKSDSVWTYYYPHGKISATVPYKNDERQGIARYFSPEGTPVMEKMFDEDYMISYRTTNAQGTWGDWNKFTGNEKIVVKYANGNVALEEEFRDGMREGTKKSYFPNGQLNDEYHYSKGMFQGPYSIYYPSGKLREKGMYKYNELDGVIETFHEDGTLDKTENYMMGTHHGKTVIYSKGVKSREITFWDGLPEE